MKLKSSVYAPILVGVVMLLVGFSDELIRLVNRVSSDAFLSVAIIQFLVFLLPVAFYCRVFGVNFVSSLKFRGFSWKKVPVLVTLLLLFFTGSLVLRFFGIFLFDGAMVNTPDAVYVANIYSSNRVLTALCFILIPALLEEILFRGIVLEEYARYGAGVAVTVSALCSAMLHASFGNFAYYFFMGVIFGAAAWITRSLIPAVAFHLIKNVWYLYASASTANYLRQAGKSALLPFLLIAAVLLLLFLFFSQMEGLYVFRARDELRESRKEVLEREVKEEKAEPEEEKKNRFLVFREVFLSPTFLLIVVLFILQAVGVF